MLTKNVHSKAPREVSRQNEHMIMLFGFEHMIQIKDDLRIRNYEFGF